MEIHGPQWKSMDLTMEINWKSMEINRSMENDGPQMETNGDQSKSIGNHRKSMNLNGNPCKSIEINL